MAYKFNSLLVYFFDLHFFFDLSSCGEPKKPLLMARRYQILLDYHLILFFLNSYLLKLSSSFQRAHTWPQDHPEKYYVQNFFFFIRAFKMELLSSADVVLSKSSAPTSCANSATSFFSLSRASKRRFFALAVSLV